MHRSLLLLAASALTLAATSAPAQAVNQDVRCLLASNFFAQAEKDPQKKQLAAATGVFYTGRVDARTNPAQLKALIVQEGKALKGPQVGQVMNVCAQTFAAKQVALRNLGQEIQKSQPKAAGQVTIPPAAAPKK